MAKRRSGRNISGILVLDKPLDESSNRSLQKVKRLFNANKAGHTGSLDPLATGVLPLCFGEATKISQFLLDSDKTYLTTIKLGVKTASGDADGEILLRSDCKHLHLNDLEIALEKFKGCITQVPSMFSALKHNGVPLYKLARQGKTVERKSREVTIFDLKILKFTNDEYTGCEIDLEISCSKGTYIRSIADDLGDLLEVGAHVSALRRTKAGPFSISESVTHETLQSILDSDDSYSSLDAVLQPADLAVQHLPAVTLSADTAGYIKQGQTVIVRHLPTQGLVRIYSDAEFIGIGTILDDGRLAPSRLFNSVQ